MPERSPFFSAAKRYLSYAAKEIAEDENVRAWANFIAMSASEQKQKWDSQAEKLATNVGWATREDIHRLEQRLEHLETILSRLTDDTRDRQSE